MKKRVPFLALEMPYGMKSQCQPKTRDPEKNIAFVNEAVKTIFGSAVPGSCWCQHRRKHGA